MTDCLSGIGRFPALLVEELSGRLCCDVRLDATVAKGQESFLTGR